MGIESNHGAEAVPDKSEGLTEQRAHFDQDGVEQFVHLQYGRFTQTLFMTRQVTTDHLNPIRQALRPDSKRGSAATSMMKTEEPQVRPGIGAGGGKPGRFHAVSFREIKLAIFQV